MNYSGSDKTTSSTDRHRLNASWLILLRWVAVVGQLLTIVFTAIFFQVQIPWQPLLVIVGVTAFSNLILTVWFRNRIRERVHNVALQLNEQQWDLLLGLIMTMDMISLTVLLFVTGGVNNPFCLFFFVNLSLSAVLLSRNWAWALNLISIIGFGWLLLDFWEIQHVGFGTSIKSIRQLGSPTLQHVGLLVSFATCSSVITYFMVRLTSSLRQQEYDLRQAQRAHAKSEKLEALGTLAAGAAHELASPLSTIAIVAKDLEKMVVDKVNSHDEDIISDVKLVRSQVDRCRKILDRMAGHAGQTVGESSQKLTVEQLWAEIIDGLEEEFHDRVIAHIHPDVANLSLNIPLNALSQSLRGLIHNAIEVEPVKSKVDISIARHRSQNKHRTNQSRQDDPLLLWQIRDHGPGMDPATLARVSEPFFTTKPPGKGMGLGVFLATNVIERLGGSIEIQSLEGIGTTVIIEL